MEKKKTIYFDMDGTIADLYGVSGWLECLDNYNNYPYIVAKPLIDLEETTRLLKRLQLKGYKVGIISWLAKYTVSSYDEEVSNAKRQWLKDHFQMNFDSIDIVAYGTPKHTLANDKNLNIIFDDDERVRNTWKGIAIDPTTTDINTYLTSLLQKCKG